MNFRILVDEDIPILVGEVAQVGTERQRRCCEGGRSGNGTVQDKKGAELWAGKRHKACQKWSSVWGGWGGRPETGQKACKVVLGKMAPAGIKWSEDDAQKTAPGGTTT
ncbi:hypothetical protein T11_1718 [Trichinella zimbabwensis]|uniref:Uncharacterized protein n=1 Tax=Trichinella zimbabwensis TaxID=268475 RepID=A0A0V1GW76_9BILA|nr:hypothetical protein T11_1718 [Trichinella zimbabwensis]